MNAFLKLDGWAGRINVPVEVVKEAGKRTTVKLLEDTTLPGARGRKAGDVVTVPSYAIRKEQTA